MRVAPFGQQPAQRKAEDTQQTQHDAEQVQVAGRKRTQQWIGRRERGKGLDIRVHPAIEQDVGVGAERHTHDDRAERRIAPTRDMAERAHH